jgi:hypothetical protein
MSTPRYNPDAIDQQIDHEERLRKIETGALPLGGASAGYEEFTYSNSGSPELPFGDGIFSGAIVVRRFGGSVSMSVTSKYITADEAGGNIIGARLLTLPEGWGPSSAITTTVMFFDPQAVAGEDPWSGMRLHIYPNGQVIFGEVVDA